MILKSLGKWARRDNPSAVDFLVNLGGGHLILEEKPRKKGHSAL